MRDVEVVPSKTSHENQPRPDRENGDGRFVGDDLAFGEHIDAAGGGSAEQTREACPGYTGLMRE